MRLFEILNRFGKNKFIRGKSLDAVKKPHKMGKTVEIFDGFLHLKMQKLYY